MERGCKQECAHLTKWGVAAWLLGLGGPKTDRCCQIRSSHIRYGQVRSDHHLVHQLLLALVLFPQSLGLLLIKVLLEGVSKNAGNGGVVMREGVSEEGGTGSRCCTASPSKHKLRDTPTLNPKPKTQTIRPDPSHTSRPHPTSPKQTFQPPPAAPLGACLPRLVGLLEHAPQAPRPRKMSTPLPTP